MTIRAPASAGRQERPAGQVLLTGADHRGGSEDPEGRARTIVVLAKEPRPGRVKTRLHSAFTAGQAAELAAAALADTLDAVRRADVRRRVLAWTGDPTGWADGFEVIDQGGGDLSDRLAHVFDTVLGADDEPTLLIAMDTPQVTSALLQMPWDGADAVIGLTDDGGYWGIGLRRRPSASVFSDIPMSTDRTGAAQLARLLELGHRVKLLPPMRDVDTPLDAARIAEQHPGLLFADRFRALTSRPVTIGPRPVDAATIFNQAYRRHALTVWTAEGVDPLRVDDLLWRGPADDVDRLVLARCEPPVLDVGCGPGRMVVALTEGGRSALGVDVSAAAVQVSLRRGGPALRRDLSDWLPGEGRWGTVLLMDSNVGIGGDVDALLRRCSELLTPGGLMVCETDPQSLVDETHDVRLDAGGLTATMRWARIGAEALARRASRLNLLMTERWQLDGRAFVAFRRL